jgi:hypothetical protein
VQDATALQSVSDISSRLAFIESFATNGAGNGMGAVDKQDGKEITP